MYTALVVDDHPFIRTSVRLQLQHDHIKVIGETDSGVDALRLIREHAPNLVILDISLPGLDGMQVLQRITALEHPPRVLMLTSQMADTFSLRCMKAGAAGFICKTDDLGELSRAVLAIRSGFTYFPEVSLSSVCRQDMQTSEKACLASLSDRELIILQYLARGLSNKAIGELMLLSNKTVSTYKSRLIEKLGVRSLIDLADLARRNGLV
ncbi:response regulator transcription factor [Pseudomonas entomophila]|uniref:response regulator transcription factor n=1 Tax=Pseudomonas entomophila TaxID=312306 RepID=UPI0015E28B48|nr:response regulator transcription factor [Pseudomonas entomophila]MBA1187447.1 response regulator transcription factor [Pseudomonas entomophila]